MAFHRSITFSLLLFFISVSPTFSSAAAAFSRNSSEKIIGNCAEKVNLAVYYESLCPYSANFISNQLIKIFNNGLIDFVNLRLVPWGNSELIANHTFNCQHGRSECFLNTIEACAINAWPALKDHFPFVHCIETLVYEQKFTNWENCFKAWNLDPTPISNCYNTGLGRKLGIQYSVETNALQPPHKYAPWIVVNGQPLYLDYSNFESYICKAYKGTPVPQACCHLSVAAGMREQRVSIRAAINKKNGTQHYQE